MNKAKNSSLLDRFVNIVRKYKYNKSKSFEAAANVKNVPENIAHVFAELYKTDANTPREAWDKFVDDIKNGGFTK
jgi:hypothetical protein